MTEDIEGLRFNTAISQMMVFTNEMTKAEQRSRALLEPFVLILSPFAPHLAEELWEVLGHQPSVSQQPWPIFDPRLTVSDRLTIPIQVNGKLRAKLDVGADATREQVEGLARPQIAEWLQGKEPKKIVYVEKKLMNFVCLSERERHDMREKRDGLRQCASRDWIFACRACLAVSRLSRALGRLRLSIPSGGGWTHNWKCPGGVLFHGTATAVGCADVRKQKL